MYREKALTEKKCLNVIIQYYTIHYKYIYYYIQITIILMCVPVST